jgi:hypothetical protein
MSDARDDDAVTEDEARLLAGLAEVLGPDDLPPGLVSRAEGLVAFMDVDSELAELLEGAAAEPVGARGSATATERLAFETADGSIALEVVVERDVVTGQVLAGALSEVVLEHLDGSVVTAVVDELGRFSIDRTRSGSVRILLQVGSAQPVRTDWFLL